MNSTTDLLDLHERTHRSLTKLITHCSGFSSEELHQELAGFGYGTIQLQLHHLIGAERYWIGVLQGRLDVDDDAPDYPSIETLEQYRQKVASATVAHLQSLNADDLSTPRSLVTWGNRVQELVPARVVLRVLTHIYHHIGQITAMCRLLGRPCNGLDYPIV